MAASTITYADKTAAVEQTNPVTELVRAVDLNEIKTVINANAALQDTNTSSIATNVTNISTAQTTANNALPKAGGTMTGSILGNQIIQGYRAISDITSSTGLDAISANYFYSVDASGGAVTITVNDAANTSSSIGYEFEFFAQDASSSITFAVSGSQSIISKDSNLSLSGTGSAAVLKKISNNVWALIGDLA